MNEQQQIRTGYPHPIAYMYEADTHCPACAAAAFGVDEDGFISAAATDSEGNPIGAVAPWDEWIEQSIEGVQIMTCGTCGGEIARYENLEEIEAAADAAGYEAGTAAGGWVLDGNSTEDAARALLRGIEDGDPMILEQIPSSPLSGEWADGLLPRDVLRDYGMTEDHPAADDVLRAYEDGYARGVVDEVTRAASAMLAPDEGAECELAAAELGEDDGTADDRPGCYRVYYDSAEGSGFLAIEAADEDDAREHARRTLSESAQVTGAQWLRAPVL